MVRLLLLLGKDFCWVGKGEGKGIGVLKLFCLRGKGCGFFSGEREGSLRGKFLSFLEVVRLDVGVLVQGMWFSCLSVLMWAIVTARVTWRSFLVQWGHLMLEESRNNEEC